MRENKIFAKRAHILHSDEVIKKYYLVYEGSDTEALYFNAVNSLKTDIGINPLIELVPIIRSYSEEGWSNPKKILDRIIQNLEENKIGYISFETLLNRIMDYFYEEKIITTSRIQAKSMWQTMVLICKEKLHETLDADVENPEQACYSILNLLQKEYNIVNVVTDISDIIKTEGLTYDEGFDRICLIVDRDKESFLSAPNNNQYTYVLNKCNEKGFGFYITNPCFEFWLLLHFNEVFSLNNNKLLENPKVTAKRRYVEQELRRLYPGYTKSLYRAEDLIQHIDTAIENEKKFCEDPQGLEAELGSNVGKLIQELKDQKS